MMFNFEFAEDDLRPSLKIEGIAPVYFDGSVKRISRYVHTQHKDGKIHEPSFCAALVNLMQRIQPKIVYDVGAFIGYFSLIAGAASSKDTQIWSFEMNDKNCQHLMANILANKHLAASRFSIVCAGVTDISEYCKPITIRGFQMFDGHLGDLDRSNIHNQNFENASESFVDFVSLDDFSLSRGIVPDLIKIDIEGWECKAIPGAEQIIKKHLPTLLVEIHADRKLQEFDMDQQSFIKSVRNLGYEICIFGDHKQRKDGSEAFLTHLSDSDIESHREGENTAIIAISPEKILEISSLIET